MPYTRPKDFEKTAYANWQSGVDTNQAQLDREVEDLSWQVAENQWDEGAGKARGADEIDGISIAARPMLSIPKIKQPMSIIDNQFRSADLSVNIHAVSEDANDDTAEVYQDLYRTMVRDSNGDQARWWAFDRAKQAGRGYYRFNTIYDEKSDDPFDQIVVLQRIFYQSSVVMDPSATMADCSDAEWGFITGWVPFDTFKRRWPKARLSKQTDDAEKMGSGSLDLDTLCQETPKWVENKNGKKAVQVAEYWTKYYTTETVWNKEKTKSREREKCEIRWSVLAPGGEDGLDVVEEQEWNGDDIPIILAFWSELQPYDSEHRYEGVVRPSRDGQKLFNLMASEGASAVTSLPKSPYIGDVRQFEPFMNAWKQSAIRTFPFLPIATVRDGDTILERPSRVVADSSILIPLMTMLHMADDFIQSTTATPDPVLGKANTKNQSGRAIQALQGQSEASTSAGIQNFADVSMKREAKIGIGMLKRIYDRKGRRINVTNREGKVRPVILNAPFTMDSKGRPALAPAQTPGQTTTQQPQGVKTYDLTTGYYGFSVTIGKGFNTRKEQGSQQLADIMERDPELGTVLAPVFLRFQDGPGMQEAAELATEYRDMKFQGLGKPKDGTVTPEMLQKKVKSQEMQIQQMQQAGSELQKQLETDQAKQQATMMKAQMDAQMKDKEIAADFAKAQLESQTRIQVAEIAAGAKITADKLDAVISLALDRSKSAQAAFDRRHEAQLKHTDLAHEVATTLGGQEHDQSMADQGHAQAQELSDQGHGQTMEQQTQAQDAAAQQAEAESASEDTGEGGVEE